MKILLFAALKDSLGSTIEMDVVGRTVQQLKTELAQQHGAVENLLERSHFAVNQEYVGDQFLFESEPNELAIIPPVSGG